MIIMLSTNGQNIWDEREGEEILPEDVFEMLKADGIDDDIIYKALGQALVSGNSEIIHDGNVECISICY